MNTSRREFMGIMAALAAMPTGAMAGTSPSRSNLPTLRGHIGDILVDCQVVQIETVENADVIDVGELSVTPFCVYKPHPFEVHFHSLDKQRYVARYVEWDVVTMHIDESGKEWVQVRVSKVRIHNDHTDLVLEMPDGR
jgi:hypothetical protein